MKHLHILYVAQNYLPMNASSITIHGIMLKLAEKGHKITLLVPQRCPKQCIPGCSLGCKDGADVLVVRIPTPAPYYLIDKMRHMRTLALAISHLFLILYALRIGRGKRFDLVVSQHHGSHLASLSAFMLSRIFKLPLFLRTHDVYDTPRNLLESLYLHLLDNLYRVVMKRSNRVFVVSEPLRLRLIETHKLAKDKVSVCPNGVDIGSFRPDVSCGSLRRSLQVEGKKILFFAGSIIEERGLTLLIQALPEIVAKCPNVLVLMVGDGPQKPELIELAQELNVTNFIRFVQPVDHKEIPRYICMSDVTIGPLKARVGTFGSVPRKVLEYMACAKPVVACYGSVSRDLIRSGHNGLLIHCNEKELATAVLKIISDPRFAKRVGLNARARVEKFFVWDKIIDEFEKVLRTAC